MNIKKELDLWNKKLIFSFQNTKKKNLNIRKTQTDNILKLQNNLSKIQFLINNQSVSISTIESFFCYSKSVLNLEPKKLTSILLQNIKLNLDTNIYFYKSYFRNIDKIIFDSQKQINFLFEDTEFSIFIFRHLQNKNLFWEDITPESLAKVFLFNIFNIEEIEDIEDIEDIDYNLVVNLQNTLFLPETKIKINWINQVVKNYTHHFFNNSPIFFKFELLQECYHRLLKKENSIKEEINSILKIIKIRLKSQISIETVWNLETQNKIQNYLDINSNLIELNENQKIIINKLLKLKKDLINIEKIEEPKIIFQIKVLDENNKSLLKKINKTYSPSLNLQRRNMKLLYFKNNQTEVEIQETTSYTEIDNTLVKMIDDKNNNILRQNLKILNITQKYSDNLKKIDELYKTLKTKDTIFNFKYQNQINCLKKENKTLIEENESLEQLIKDDIEFINKLKTLKNSNSHNNSMLQDTINYKKNKIKNTFQNIYDKSFKNAKVYKKIYQKNQIQLKKLEQKRKNVKNNRSNIQFEIDKLESKIQGNSGNKNDIHANKLDSILNYFLIKLEVQDIKLLTDKLKFIESSKKELELEHYQINLEEKMLDKKIIAFIDSFDSTNIENTILLNYNKQEYNIDISQIILKLIKFQYLYFNLEIIQNTLSIFNKNTVNFDYQKLEYKIFNLESKLNLIFIKLQKEKLNFDKRKQNELLESFFTNNSTVLKDYMKTNKKINNINFIIQNTESKIKKIKKLENIILNK